MTTRSPLRLRLLFLTMAATLIPAIVVAWVARTVSSRALSSRIEHQQVTLARRVAQEVDMEIRSAQSILAFEARHLYDTRMNLSDAQKGLEHLLQSVPSFEEVMIVLGNGQERLKLNRDGVSRQLIRRPVNVRAPDVGAPFFSGKRLPTILLSEPIRAPGTRSGSAVLMAKMSFDSLGRLMMENRVGAGGSAFIVNDRGTLLAHPDEKLVKRHENFSWVPVVEHWQHQPTKPTKVEDYEDRNGQSLVAIAYPIPLLQSALVVQQPTREVFAPLRQMSNRVLFWTLACLVVFIGIAVAVAWRILEPLQQLHQAAQQIGRGNDDVFLDIQTRDELEELGHAFNEMASSLRKLEQMRQDLMNMVVHDMKAPLSSILTALEYLLMGELGSLSPDQKKFIQLSWRSGHDLFTLIQNLLDVARMQEGKLTLHKEPLEALAWAEAVITSFRTQAESSRKKLHLETVSPLPVVEADTALLKRVLNNLIANALQHTVSGVGEIVVSLQEDDGDLLVHVRDNGEGIPSEDLQRIFEKFTQSGKQTVVRLKGTGLGLTFCKMAVEAHGGAISVSSTPNQGSTFTVRLPKTAALKKSPDPVEAAPSEATLV